MTALLEIHDLRFTLGEFTLGPLSLEVEAGGYHLGPLSLEVEAGGYLVLLGPSGCGKTTLLRAIAGVHHAQPGTLFLGGRDVGALAPQARRVGYVAQVSDLFGHLTVRKNVAFGLRYLGLEPAAREARLARIVTLLGLEALLDRSPGTLSGGEARRVALARSLAVEPRVLLLDEPLSMLDPNARTEVLAALRTIHDELSTAVIHVTHDREETWAVAGAGGTNDRCAVMRTGRIEQTGSVHALFRAPHTRFVAEFLGGANVLPARFETREGRPVAVLDLGEFELAGPVAFERGYVQIRPESLVPAAPGAEGAIRSRVRSVADRGLYQELAVEADGGNILRVHLILGDQERPAPGEMLALRCAIPPHPIRE